MILVRFNEERGILETELSGELSQQEILAYVNSLRENRQSYPDHLKILTKATNAHINLAKEALDVIIAEINKHPGMYENVHHAAVIASPRETAISLLFEEFTKSGTYEFKVFSTQEAALDWLKSH